jgi:transposase InsO family protein
MDAWPNSTGMLRTRASAMPISNQAHPQLNGKVERSHRSDEQEFYQLLTYKGDVDLEAKLDEWERFYNFARPHGAFNGKTPYEALRYKL